MVWQPLNPVIVQVVDEPTRETSVADILLGAVGLVGFVLLMAALVGLAAGGLFILARKWRERREPADRPADDISLRLNALEPPSPRADVTASGRR